MERLTEKHWRNLDPWECCGQDRFCGRGSNDLGGCKNGCIVPKLYARLAAYEDAMQLGRAQELAQAEMDGRLVARGRWIEHTGEYENYCECSLCHYCPDAPLDMTNYCPNCGAKMGGKR